MNDQDTNTSLLAISIIGGVIALIATVTEDKLSWVGYGATLAAAYVATLSWVVYATSRQEKKVLLLAGYSTAALVAAGSATAMNSSQQSWRLQMTFAGAMMLGAAALAVELFNERSPSRLRHSAGVLPPPPSTKSSPPPPPPASSFFQQLSLADQISVNETGMTLAERATWGQGAGTSSAGASGVYLAPESSAQQSADMGQGTESSATTTGTTSSGGK